MTKKYYSMLILFGLLLLSFSVFSTVINAQTKSSNTKENNLFVFVGEKIEVKGFSPDLEENEILMDSVYKAKYKIIQTIYGNYDKDIIEFEAYDHFGYPHFANYKYTLLFVSKDDGQYYHQKYQYFDVYKTKNGKWATCGDPYKFDEPYRKNIKAVKLEFDKPLFFDIDKELPHYVDEYVRKIFVEPYFKIKDNQAKCLMGTYVDQLFKIKKEGELKERGLF